MSLSTSRISRAAFMLAFLFLSGCPWGDNSSPCGDNKVCCILNYGEGKRVEQCVVDGEACSALATKNSLGNGWPKPETSTSVNVCKKK